ncbi:MAG: hypothetical protein JWO78_1804 [Micavibrio sp.]|nr:hypothetical protein [Micavibrio sp.]
MTLKFTTNYGLPTGPMKKSVSIMARDDNGNVMPAMTLYAANPDFPVKDLNKLAEIIASQFNNQPVPMNLDAGDCHLHFARAKNGEQLSNGYNLVFRTPDSGITASEGVCIRLAHAVSPYVESEIHTRFAKVIASSFDAINMGMRRVAAMAPKSGPDLAPQT